MAYLIGGVVGAALFAFLITRLCLWIAGFFAKGAARIWWAYGAVAAFMVVAAVFGQASLMHLFMLALLLVFDIWRQAKKNDRAVYERKPMSLD